MKAIVVIAAAVLLAVCLWIWSSGSQVEQAPVVTDSVPDSALAEPSAAGDGQSASPDVDARQRVADLEGALALATERREEAERALDALESEVEELEAFIADIEARGEDPADYAEEGLQLFQPSFFKYQDGLIALEAAQELEDATKTALAEAKKALDGGQ